MHVTFSLFLVKKLFSTSLILSSYWSDDWYSLNTTRLADFIPNKSIEWGILFSPEKAVKEVYHVFKSLNPDHFLVRISSPKHFAILDQIISGPRTEPRKIRTTDWTNKSRIKNPYHVLKSGPARIFGTVRPSMLFTVRFQVTYDS